MSYYPNKYPDDPFALNNYGIYHLNVKEAAALVVKILHLGGYADFKVKYEPKDGCYYLRDPELEKVLDEHIKKFEKILINGINQGTLKADQLSRHLNEEIIPEETYLEESKLRDWLSERNYDIEGTWYHEYVEELIELQNAVAGAITTTRARQKHPTLYEEYTQTHEDDETFVLHTEIADLQSELEGYRKRIEAKPEKPLSTIERNTLLKLVIGMATAGYSYNPKAMKNSAVTDITNDLVRLGIDITDDTVRKWLSKATEFLPQEA